MKNYTTNNFYKASLLHAHGFMLLDVLAKPKPKVTQYVFEHNGALNALLKTLEGHHWPRVDADKLTKSNKFLNTARKTALRGEWMVRSTPAPPTQEEMDRRRLEREQAREKFIVPAAKIVAPAPVQLPTIVIESEVIVDDPPKVEVVAPTAKSQTTSTPSKPELIPYTEIAKHNPFAGLGDLLKKAS